MTPELAVHFWGGPACGAVLRCLPEELPVNLCRHPDHPEAEYILFKQLATGKLIARYIREQ